jgi:chemotaxis protein CheY-P-specific phosphatase CheC
MSDVTDENEQEQERLYELTSLGASHASTAFSMLLDRAMAPSAPEFREVGEYCSDDSWSTGVIFQADGELSGLVAILILGDSRGAVEERLIRFEDVGEAHKSVESALRELGNIVASHTMSAIADRLGGRILLSVPVLVMDAADEAFASMLRERSTERCVECELTDSAREIRVRLVFAPDPKS